MVGVAVGMFGGRRALWMPAATTSKTRLIIIFPPTAASKTAQTTTAHPATLSHNNTQTRTPSRLRRSSSLSQTNADITKPATCRSTSTMNHTKQHLQSQQTHTPIPMAAQVDCNSPHPLYKHKPIQRPQLHRYTNSYSHSPL